MPIHEKGNELLPEDRQLLLFREGSQREAVIALFNKYPNDRMSAEEVHRRLHSKSPLTSIRRALSDLKKEGIINKDTQYRKMGSYGIHITTYYKAW